MESNTFKRMCFLLNCERPGAFSTVGNDVEMRSRSLNVKDSEKEHKHFLSPRSGTIAHCWEEGIAEKPADSETGGYFL